MGEAINLVENFKVEKVIFNCGEFNELEQQLIKALEKKKIPYCSCIKELNIDDLFLECELSNIKDTGFDFFAFLNCYWISNKIYGAFVILMFFSIV